MRQGCGRNADTRLVIHANEQQVVLEDLTDPTDPVQMVCRMHANNLRPPLGWALSDNRSSRGLAGAPLQPDQPKRGAARSRGSGSGPAAAATPGPGAAADAEGTAPARDEQMTTPGQPGTAEEMRPAENEAPPEEQPKRKAKGLLDRAFEWTGDQHSVLTQREPGPEDP